jgi:hypothetical protein
MAPKRSKDKDRTTVRSSIVMPKELWRRGRIVCLDENMDFQDLVVEALRRYLDAYDRKNGSMK